MILSFGFVTELKKALQDAFSVYLHFHDGCGGQYFTLERTDNDIHAFICDYLQKRNLTAVFAEDDLQFTVTETKLC